jgi:4-amino-4-deoxy-L-arabinose transferase-like glycosyltransferase
VLASEHKGLKQLVFADEVKPVDVLLKAQKEGAQAAEFPDRPEDRNRGRLAASSAFLTRASQVEQRGLATGAPPPFEREVHLERGEREPLEDPSDEVVAHRNLEGNIPAVLIPLRARPWLILASVTLVPRLLLALFLGIWGEPERWEYDVIAESIHAGEGHNYQRGIHHYAAYAPPLWSYCLAGLLALPGESRASIQWAQGFLCIGAAAACALLAKRLTGRSTTAWLCGALVALQPSLLYYSVVKSDPLPLNAFLLSLIALFGTILVDRPEPPSTFGFGLLVALGTLSRGTPAIALPIVALILAAKGRSRAFIPVLSMALGFGLGLSPWLIRNAIYVGEPLITSTSGENFWRGNNERATGGIVDKTGRTLTDLSPDARADSPFPPAIREVLALGSEADRQRVFTAEAWRFIRSQPRQALLLFAEKMKIFWWRVKSRPGDYPEMQARLYEWIYRTELLLAVAGLGALAAGRLPLSPRSGPMTLTLLMALILGISVLQSAFYVQGRHRFLIEPLLLVLTAWGAEGVLARAHRLRGPAE